MLLKPAHHRALAAIKSGPGTYPVGVALARADEQAIGEGSRRDEKRELLYGPWLDAAASSDFVGVQTYTRARVGKDGDLPPDAGVELTQMGSDRQTFARTVKPSARLLGSIARRNGPA